MELQQLKYFKTVAEIGKISEAAEALFISAPALSTSISRLEKELGFTLFDRTNNKILLNPQGRIFLTHINQIFSNLDTAIDEMRQSLQPQGSHISIVGVNTAMWVNLITAFTSDNPHFTLSWSATSLKSLSENGFSPQHSFLLATEDDIPEGYVQELEGVFLFDSFPCMMLHKEHPLAGSASIDLKRLASERIFMPAPGYSLHNRLIKLFQRSNLPVPVDNSYSYLSRQQMVMQNLGVSFFSTYAGYTPNPNLCYIPLEDPYGPWRIHLYWRKNHALTEDERCFMNYAKDFYSSQH